MGKTDTSKNSSHPSDYDAEASSTNVIMPDGFGDSFSDKVIRARFVRKVYAILLSQLAVTTAFVAVFVFTPAIRRFYCDDVRVDAQTGVEVCYRGSSNGLIVYIVSYVVFFVTYLSLACCESLRRRSPANVICMCLFTCAFSLMASSIAIYHNVWWVMMAMGITAALCLGLTVFAMQTKWDVTGKGMYLFAAMWVLFLFGIVAIIFSANGYPVMYTVYSALVALLFSMFLVYDTQQIMGGRKYSISPEEHVIAAVQLYVDVMYIFLAILNLGGRR